jgi:RecB family exonuclease
MPLHLLKGPLGSGKTSFLLDLTAQAHTAESALYVLPSDYTAGEVRRLYLKTRKTPLLGEVFLSWSHFLSRLAGINQPTISRIHLTLFLYQLLKTHPLRYFRAENVSIGIAREFANTIMALKQNLIEPAHLRRELETRGSLKENDLLTVFERYEEEKAKRGIIDDGDVALLAAANINQGTPHALTGIESIFIDEFQTLQPGVRTIVHQLSQTLKSINIWATHPTVESFADRIETLHAEKPETSELESFSCRSPTMEARFIAHRIFDLINENDEVEPSEISVSIRSNDAFVCNLLAECERYGLLDTAHAIDTPMAAPIIHRALSQEVLSEMNHTGTVAHFCEHLSDQLRRFDLLPRCTTDIPSPQIRTSASRNLAAIGTLDQLLRALTTKAKILGTGEIPRRSFMELIRDALMNATPWGRLETALPFSLRPLESIPVRKSSISFIPRLVEGHIPQITSERLFFGEMENWGETSDSIFDEIFEGPEEKLIRETDLFNSVLQKTVKTSIATHSVIDHSGNETIQSSFLDNIGQSTPIDISPEILSQRKTRSFEKRLQNAIAIEKERFRAHPGHPQHHGIIMDAQVKRMLRNRFTETAMSPTSLERYAECPFQFFVEKVLNLKPEEEITPDILPKDRGTIIHALLERFYRDYIGAFKAAIHEPTKEKEITSIVDKLVDQVFLEHASLIGYASPSLDAYQRRAVKTLALQVIKLELYLARDVPQPLLPEKNEWCFGEGNVPPLEVKVPEDTPVKIKGRVDRIDTSEDKRSFAVTDFKTGSQVNSVKKQIADGLHLQLPLYVEATRRLLMPDAEPLGGILLGVQQSEKKHGFLKKFYNDVHYSLSKRLSTLLDNEAWSELLQSALAFTGKYAAAIRQGYFPVKPHKCNDYCDYKDICRFNEDAD